MQWSGFLKSNYTLLAACECNSSPWSEDLVRGIFYWESLEGEADLVWGSFGLFIILEVEVKGDWLISRRLNKFLFDIERIW